MYTLDVFVCVEICLTLCVVIVVLESSLQWLTWIQVAQSLTLTAIWV